MANATMIEGIGCLADRLAMLLDPSLLLDDVCSSQSPPWMMDDWQRDAMRTTADRVLMLAGRRVGKSTVSACLALHRALFFPGNLVLLVGPSLRQSTELFATMVRSYDAIGRPVEAIQESKTAVEFKNGSRVISLPGTGGTIRGFSPNLIVIDEAAQTDDEMYVALAPMLATGACSLLCLSTPYGKRGWFHAAWTDEGQDWEKISIPARLCPRIGREFLDGERRRLGERWYRQEYECSFEETVDQVFSTELVERMFDTDRKPLFAMGA